MYSVGFFIKKIREERNYGNYQQCIDILKDQACVEVIDPDRGTLEQREKSLFKLIVRVFDRNKVLTVV